MLCLLRRATIRASPASSTLSCPLPSSTSFYSSPITIHITTAQRPFTYSPLATQKSMPSRPKPPPDSELEESYLKGSGPGGQKINKTNSAVQLKHIPTGIVVKSQATRSRAQNRKHAREILAQKLDDLRNGDESRSNIVGQVKKKRADSAAKKSRRKYTKLEEEKARDSASAAPGEQSAGSSVDAAGWQDSITAGDADLSTTDQTPMRTKETASSSSALDSTTSSKNSSKQ